MRKRTISLMIIVALVVMINVQVNAQNVGIGPNVFTPDNSAGLEMQFTNKGLLIPRVALASTTDGTTIPSPAHSLLVYNNGGTGALNPEGFYYNAGTPGSPNWVRLATDNANCLGCVSMVSNISTSTMTWKDCAQSCGSKIDGGYDDWRMPSLEEAIYYTFFAPNISFTPSSNSIWTTTPSTSNTGSWVIFKESDGYWNSYYYNNNTYCRCVR